MRIGTYRHRINLERPDNAQDATGGVVPGFTLAHRVWSRIEPIRGREANAGDQLLAEADTRIFIRYSTFVEEINEKWRITFGSRVYNVVSVGELYMGRREIEINCKSGRNDG